MNFTENFFLYFDTYKFFANLMIYELIARDSWTISSEDQFKSLNPCWKEQI